MFDDAKYPPESIQSLAKVASGIPRPQEPTIQFDGNGQVPPLPVGTSFSMVENLVIIWGRDRSIIQNSSSLAQAIKTAEECNGELIVHAAQLKVLREVQAGYSDSSPVWEALEDEIQSLVAMLKDDVGDVMVTLAMVSEIEGFGMVEAFIQAYNEIRNRKGYLGADGKYYKAEA
jgi:hypothetical protein